MLAILTQQEGAAAPVELVMQVSRGDDNRLTGSVRSAWDPEGREFSGMLELMRVFEDLVPVDRSGQQPRAPGGDQLPGPGVGGE